MIAHRHAISVRFYSFDLDSGLAVETFRCNVARILPALDVDACELPGIGVGVAADEDIRIVRGSLSISVNVVHLDVRDGDTVGRDAGRTTVDCLKNIAGSAGAWSKLASGDSR